MPPFYTGIFESNNNKSLHIDYHLPYDIYWFSQQQTKKTILINPSSPLSSLTTTIQHKKKKISSPKQRQPLVYKKILRNVYTDQLRQSLLSSYDAERAPVCDCKSPGTCEYSTCLNRIMLTECLPNCACGTFPIDSHFTIR